MKAIFPCLGSLIMTKNDIEKLKDYYDSRQIENTDNSTLIITNNFFNYFNDNSQLILDNVTPLTVSKLKNILGISSSAQKTTPVSSTSLSQTRHTLLSSCLEVPLHTVVCF